MAETGGPGVLIVIQGSGKLRAEGKDCGLEKGIPFSSGKEWNRLLRAKADWRFT